MTNEEKRSWLSAAHVVSAVASFSTVVISYWAVQNALAETKAARTAVADQRAHAIKVFEASQAARLAFDRMTTRTRIMQTVEGWDIARTADGMAAPQSPEFGTIRNFGPGAALNCSAEFTVVEINGERLADQQVSSVTCAPMNILPNGSAHVYALPPCITDDKERSVRFATGHVTFTCYTNAGEKMSSVQEVDIRPDYENGTLVMLFRGPRFIDHFGWL